MASVLTVAMDLENKTREKGFKLTSLNIGMYGWKIISFNSFSRIHYCKNILFNYLYKCEVEYVDWDWETGEITIICENGFYNRYV